MKSWAAMWGVFLVCVNAQSCPTCQNSGTCTEPNEFCDCLESFYGQFCEISDSANLAIRFVARGIDGAGFLGWVVEKPLLGTEYNVFLNTRGLCDLTSGEIPWSVSTDVTGGKTIQTTASFGQLVECGFTRIDSATGIELHGQSILDLVASYDQRVVIEHVSDIVYRFDYFTHNSVPVSIEKVLHLGSRETAVVNTPSTLRLFATNAMLYELEESSRDFDQGDFIFAQQSMDENVAVLGVELLRVWFSESDDIKPTLYTVPADKITVIQDNIAGSITFAVEVPPLFDCSSCYLHAESVLQLVTTKSSDTSKSKTRSKASFVIN